MFARRERLSRLDFTKVSEDRTAIRAASTHFSVVSSRAAVGCAVVVSKKVAKSSIGRHLLKRRVRESMKPWCRGTNGIIIYARAGSATLPYADITKEIEPLLQRVTS